MISANNLSDQRRRYLVIQSNKMWLCDFLSSLNSPPYFAHRFMSFPVTWEIYDRVAMPFSNVYFSIVLYYYIFSYFVLFVVIVCASFLLLKLFVLNKLFVRTFCSSLFALSRMISVASMLFSANSVIRW